MGRLGQGQQNGRCLLALVPARVTIMYHTGLHGQGHFCQPNHSPDLRAAD
jgi:hypothetical protein